MALSFAMMKRQDDRTSEAVISLLRSHQGFKKLSESEGNDIIKRDQEDETKLAAGIATAVKKGVLPAVSGACQPTTIDVVGKDADKVASEILEKLPGKEGNVVVLTGLSGTGKGTTVKKLQQWLPNCVCWSNGNVFRTLTHLVSDFCEKQKRDFCADVLTPQLLEECSERLSFDRFGEDFDVVIDKTQRVSEIQNTTLKMPHISNRVPTVAEQTQGEVVKFAASAVATLQKAGKNVILEGRAQTLNYIPTSYRFQLTIPDVSLLGQRRAAQRVMAAALLALGEKNEATDEEVQNALLRAADAL